MNTSTEENFTANTAANTGADAGSRVQEASEIVVSNISKTYGTGPFAKNVIKDCSFTIESNKLTVMIGPSGCGKSTLIQLIAGFETPDTGTITMNGAPSGRALRVSAFVRPSVARKMPTTLIAEDASARCQCVLVTKTSVPAFCP